MLSDLDLHANVRDAYRQAMAQHRTQREGFNWVVGLLLEQRPHLQPGNARQVAAVMLSNEPQLSAAPALSS